MLMLYQYQYKLGLVACILFDKCSSCWEATMWRWGGLGELSSHRQYHLPVLLHKFVFAKWDMWNGSRMVLVCKHYDSSSAQTLRIPESHSRSGHYSSGLHHNL